jgi:hypothetical protein
VTLCVAGLFLLYYAATEIKEAAEDADRRGN